MNDNEPYLSKLEKLDRVDSAMAPAGQSWRLCTAHRNPYLNLLDRDVVTTKAKGKGRCCLRNCLHVR